MTVASGHPLHEAFGITGVFPEQRFSEALEVAETSGAVVESMERLSKRDEDEAQLSMRLLTVAAGVFVAILVGGLIIFMIFRIAGFYVGTINDAVNMTN